MQNLRQISMEILKTKEIQKCKLKWKCNRIFCTLDHTYLYRKVNKIFQAVSHPDQSSSPESSFDCQKCGLKCESMSRLEVHNRLKHEDVANFECESCNFKGCKKELLTKHISSTHKVDCRKCSKTFSSVQSMEERFKKKHSKDETVVEKKVKEKKKQKSNKNESRTQASPISEPVIDIEERESISTGTEEETTASDTSLSTMSSNVSEFSNSSSEERQESREEEEL